MPCRYSNAVNIKSLRLNDVLFLGHALTPSAHHHTALLHPLCLFRAASGREIGNWTVKF